MRGVLGRTRAGKVVKKSKRGLTCETLCCVSVRFLRIRRRGEGEEEEEWKKRRSDKGETKRDRGKGGFPRFTSFSPLEVELVLIRGHVSSRPE